MTTTSDECTIAETLRDLFAGGGNVSSALADFGAADFFRADLPSAVRHVFGEQGRAGAHSDALTTVAATVLARHASVDAAVALETSASLTRPGPALGPDGLSGALLVLGEPDRVAVGCCDVEGHPVLAMLDARGSGVSAEPVRGIDPALDLCRVLADSAPIERVLSGARAQAWWAESVAWGRVALSWQLVGGARTALRQAAEHARTREQFGRAIGEFQAVQHRLAETLVAIEAAQSLLMLADDPLDPVLAATAKFLAGQSYEVTARHCLQVLGGIGFTAEHPFDLFLRRGFALDVLLGSCTQLAVALGHDLLETGRAPLLCRL